MKEANFTLSKYNALGLQKYVFADIEAEFNNLNPYDEEETRKFYDGDGDFEIFDIYRIEGTEFVDLIYRLDQPDEFQTRISMQAFKMMFEPA